MTKHRLELFSDGVFAIILTLLVFDLHLPAAHNLAAFREAAPSLVVHAASFFLVGALWYAHHAILAAVSEVHENTYKLNLLALFWPTLIPFAARSAAERPLEPLGACILAACTSFYLLSLLAVRFTGHSTFDETPEKRHYRNKMWTLFAAVIFINLASAAVALITPWPAYATAILTAILFMFVARHPAEIERRFPSPTS